MQALVVRANPPAIEVVSDRPPPRPGPGEALVRVRLAGICATDLEIARGYMRFEGVPGHEFVGTVVEGPAELGGRRVVGEINCACRRCAVCGRGLPNHCPRRTVLGIAGRDGAFAEYLTLPVRNLHRVPDHVTDEQAVFVEPLAAAAHILDDYCFDSETKVAVIGTGRLGLLVTQVLAFRKCNMTVVGRNPRTLALCRKWGLDAVSARTITPRNEYDAIVECTGAPAGLRMALALCRPCGTIILKSTYASETRIDLAPAVVNEVRIVGNRCGSFAWALQFLAQGHARTQELITGSFPLRDGLAALKAAGQPHQIKVLLRPEAT